VTRVGSDGCIWHVAIELISYDSISRAINQKRRLVEFPARQPCRQAETLKKTVSPLRQTGVMVIFVRIRKYVDLAPKAHRVPPIIKEMVSKFPPTLTLSV
jgi:hypothetical protein